MAKGKSGGKGKGASSGGKGASGGKGKTGKAAPEEKAEGATSGGGSGSRMSSKSYKSTVDDVVGSTQVRQTDFDLKAVHLLDYLQKNGNRAPEALAYLKQAAQGVQRDDILNWRAYVYTLLRKFDEKAYKEMKAASGDRVVGNRTERSGAAPASAASAPAGATTSEPQRPQGDASTRQPPAPPPLQDYLAQAGFFSGPSAPPAPPPPAAPAPGHQDLELNAKAPEFTPGQSWDGRIVGVTPQAPPVYSPLPVYYPSAPYQPYGYQPGYAPYGYGYQPGMMPPQMAAQPMPMAGAPGAGAGAQAGGKKGGGRRTKEGGGKKGKGGGEGAAGEGAGGKEAAESKPDKDAASHEEGSGGEAGAGGEPAGQPPKWSAGAAGHDKQECKPCAFYHTKGCSSGEQCQFCHMCGPGEKKKRKKEGAAAPKDAKK
mmetsp:Transcript_111270/g.310874  ORF Transcript_111270/g.310874 Transcript_111270/m.310874 type:complete len:427 (+) Transcript_111270:1-1281(+)